MLQFMGFHPALTFRARLSGSYNGPAAMLDARPAEGTMRRRRWVEVGCALGCLACAGPEPVGLRAAIEGPGPRVVYDLTHKPLPEVPLPSDSATRMDPTSATGRRLNISLRADTKAEARLRERADTLDGFGVFAPITVSFDAPLDLENIRDRHARNHDFSDDAVLLVNVDPRSRGFGEAVPLDAGQGNYPLGLEWPGQYWDQDEHADSLSLLFETHDEDLNGNGVLDPYEDVDFDGVLDRPNTWSGKPTSLITPENVREWLARDDRPADDLITFYERQTNTLILWPVVPLRPATRYAVVLTRRLTGADGNPVRSPFPYIHPLDQTADLAPLRDILARPEYGLTLDDVAFAWTFTTQTTTTELEAIRAGLYGHGPLSWLHDAYPPDLAPKVVRDPDEQGVLPDRPYILPGDVAAPVLELAGPLLGYPDPVVKALEYDAAFTDYYVLGSFTSPSFLVDRDGIATPMYPADDNEAFEMDLNAGIAVQGPGRVTFICSIPKPTAEHHPPFPVMIYGHGFSGAPFEIFGFAGRMAQYGYALCGLDAVGHGLALPADEAIPYDQIVPELLGSLGLGAFYRAFQGGRIRDLDNDGKATANDNGGDFWSYDVFHLRDNVRQLVVDHLRFIQVLRSLGSIEWAADTNGNGLKDDRMGDWNGDGVVDIGGPSNRAYPTWGQSMGGIMTQVLAAVEPTIRAATPISGGGGLIHVGLRSTNPGVPEGALMPLMGPFVVFSPLGDEHDTVEIAWMINDQHREYRDRPRGWPHYYPVARTTAIRPGDRVVVRNLTNGVEVRAFRHPDGRGFRVSLPADAPGAVEKRPLLGLHDGDTQPVPVTCAPGTWTVPVDDEGRPTGPADCAEHHPERALLFGDAVQVEVHDGWDGPVKWVLDRFEIPVTFQGAIFPAGAPLVAIETGFGKARNTPDFRRLIVVAAHVLARGDPIAYARHWRREERLDFSYDPDAAPQTNMLLYHSIGDPNVPVSASLALARAAGILDYLPGPAGGVPANDRLNAAFVGEVVEGFFRHLSTRYTLADWAKPGCQRKLTDLRWPDEFKDFVASDPSIPLPLHADPDDLDGGSDEYGEGGLSPPVRATLSTPDGTLALRLPYTSPMGAHGVEPSNPSRAFNINNLVENQIAVFMVTDGVVLSDDPCLALSRCEPERPDSVCCHYLPRPVLDGAPLASNPAMSCP